MFGCKVYSLGHLIQTHIGYPMLLYPRGRIRSIRQYPLAHSVYHEYTFMLPNTLYSVYNNMLHTDASSTAQLHSSV